MKWKSYDKSNKMIEGLKWWEREREREREQQMILVASQAAEKSRAIAFA